MATDQGRRDRDEPVREVVRAREIGASEEMIRGVMGYVVALARRYQGLGLDFDELVAAGNLGVVEAATRFDPDRSVKFISYADWWIRKAIFDEVDARSAPVRLPRYQLAKLRRIRLARDEWIRNRHEEPDLEQLTSASGLPMPDVVRLSLHLRGPISIEEPGRRVENRPIGELLTDRGSEGPLRSAIRQQLTDRLRSRFVRLAAHERDVLDKRFGLDGGDARTLRQAGRELGISRERVRQIELRALLKLRDLL